MATRFFVGVDLGQCRDHTAVAVLERGEEQGPWDATLFAHRKWGVLRLCHLERMPLGTPYPAVVERVKAVTRCADLREQCMLAVDATGVGRPVVELLRGAELGCNIYPVMITGGDAENSEGGYYRVPKRDLVVGLQVLLQRGGLQISGRLEQGPALAREMAQMRVKVTAGGREEYGAWREGEHDDMVFAVALACWNAQMVCGRTLFGDAEWWKRDDQGRWNVGLEEAMERLRVVEEKRREGR